MANENQDPLAGLPKPVESERVSPLRTREDQAKDSSRWWLESSIKPEEKAAEPEENVLQSESAQAIDSTMSSVAQDGVASAAESIEKVRQPQPYEPHLPTSKKSGTTGLFLLIGVAAIAILILFLRI